MEPAGCDGAGVERRWQSYKSQFEWDGSLRDIYVFDTDLVDWQKLIDFLRTSPHELSYKLDSQQAVLPLDVAEAFADGEKASALLSIKVGGMCLDCHFFGQSEIELDVDPREVNDEAQFHQLTGFMNDVARLLRVLFD